MGARINAEIEKPVNPSKDFQPQRLCLMMHCFALVYTYS